MLIAVTAFTVIAKPAYAAEPEPTTVSLTDIVIFQNLIDTGDFLAVVPYQVSYTTEPTQNIDETYIFRLLSPDGLTENGTVTAYPYYNGGYGNGVVSFYFAAGMSFNGSYIFRVQQNPAVYPAAQYWDFIITDSNYSAAADQQVALKTKVVTSATFLSTVYSVALLSTSESGATVLSASGELYYLNAIPGLQQMAPNVFAVNLEDPDFTKRTWATTFADALRTKYNGTLLDEFFTGYAGLLSNTKSATATVISLILAVALILFSVWKGRATMLAATVDGYNALLLFMLLGIFPMEAAGGVAFGSTVMAGVVLFLNRS